ncbi:MAG: outer membrane beta-barrel protein [Elusimicrobiota bacterium]
MFLTVTFSNAEHFRFEIKGSTYHPGNDVFKEVYGSGIIVGSELSFNVWKGLEIWIGGRFTSQKGEMTFTEEETKLKIYPVEGGFRYKLSLSQFFPYLCAGVGYCTIKEDTPVRDVSESGMSYLVKVGSYIKAGKRIVFDLNFNYTYCRIEISQEVLNIGGIGVGVGIGYEF